ncbi:HAD family hydrolase [Paenibacillus sp. Y412MC10]|uniref:HAD family hydrolase n=1 Tax=Geobacillus sp. (strain Y412MC10) TaxID=481743 RepID=UPI0001B9EDB7|nr:HAD family hydrolase [Paenibacillus sp. Y412MC10]ACX65976.1 HAD-superfamily hydrolase, subfamily IA, variant 1 [Paenibacillus sp. Y412MC10]
MNTIQAVLFDFDGTLADTLPLSFKAFRAVFLKYEGKRLTDAEIVQTFGPTEEEIIANHLSNPAHVDEAVEYYYEVFEQDFQEHVQVSEAVQDLIVKLSDLRIPMVIITGKSRRCLDICLRNLKLDGYFAATITGDEVERSKPDPEGIFKAVQLLGLRTSDVVFVGDSDADIAAGKSAQVLTIGAHWFDTVQNAQFAVEPDNIFTRPDQLITWIMTRNH